MEADGTANAQAMAQVTSQPKITSHDRLGIGQMDRNGCVPHFGTTHAHSTPTLTLRKRNLPYFDTTQAQFTPTLALRMRNLPLLWHYACAVYPYFGTTHAQSTPTLTTYAQSTTLSKCSRTRKLQM